MKNINRKFEKLFAFNKESVVRSLPERKYRGLLLEDTIDLRPFFDNGGNGNGFKELRVYEVEEGCQIGSLLRNEGFDDDVNTDVLKVAFVDGNLSCYFDGNLWVSKMTASKELYIGRLLKDYSGETLETIANRCENSVIGKNEHAYGFRYATAEIGSVIDARCYISNSDATPVIMNIARGDIVFTKDGEYGESTLIVSISKSGKYYVSYFDGIKRIVEDFNEDGDLESYSDVNRYGYTTYDKHGKTIDEVLE